MTLTDSPTEFEYGGSLTSGPGSGTSVTYYPPSWIAGNGDYWRNRVLDLDAFDPDAPFIPRGKTYRLRSNPNQVLEDPFDLKNLRFLDPALIKKKWAELERLAAKENGKVVVGMIGVGGTISMRPNSDNTLEPVLDPNYLLAFAGNGLKDRFSVSSLEFPTSMDSSQEEIDYVADLVIAMSWIWKNSSEKLRSKFSGFLITHGTDTIADAGCYLKMMLGPDCPFSVGMVGAQCSIDPEGNRYSDVSANIVNSFLTLNLLKREEKVAIFDYAGGTSGGAYDPVGVIKDNDKTPNYLRSPAHPLILDAGHFANDGIHLPFSDLYAEHLRRNPSPLKERFWPIILRGYKRDYSIESRMGERPALHTRNILSASQNEIVAVVLTSYGSFTANNKLRDAVMHAASSTGRLFLAASPFPDGKTDESRYAPAEGLKDHAVHILPIALSAKITLGWHIYGNDIKKLRDFILNTNYVGEQVPSEWAKLTQKNKRGTKIGAPSESYDRFRN